MPFALRFPWLPPMSLKLFGFSDAIARPVDPPSDPAQVAADADRALLSAALKDLPPHLQRDVGGEG